MQIKIPAYLFRLLLSVLFVGRSQKRFSTILTLMISTDPHIGQLKLKQFIYFEKKNKIHLESMPKRFFFT